MAKIEVLLPQLGEGVIEATITRWLMELNSEIEEDDPIVEIATDKVDSEIPAPVSGTIIEVFFSEGDTPKVGDVIAIIESKGELDSEFEVISKSYEKNEEVPPPKNIVKEEPVAVKTKQTNTIITPFIRHFASQRGINYDELQQLSGTGDSGSITREDVLNYFKTNNSLVSAVLEKNEQKQKHIKERYVPKEGEEVVELEGARKIIADRMLASVHTAPHVTSTVEVDVTEMVQWRESIKRGFIAEHGINITYTPIVMQIVVQALKEFPGVNVSLIDNQIIKKKYINIGIATALENGNLIVPVVKNTDHLNLTKTAIQLVDLTNRARSGGLKPGEASGGTFTITNLGQFNNVMGTPIINQPESAILAVGAIKKRAWVVENQGTQTIGVRDVLTLSLSYDHRIIDGALGGAFLNKIGLLLEKFIPQL